MTRPPLPSSGSSATASSTPVRPMPLTTASSEEDKPREHQDAAASYQHLHTSPVDVVPSQQQRVPGNGTFGRSGSVHRCDIEATDNDRRAYAEAEQSPHTQATTTEPAAAEPSTSDTVQGSSSRNQSEDDVARDAITAVSAQANGESTDNNYHGIDNPSAALPSVANGRRTNRSHNPRIPPSHKRYSVGEAGNSEDEYVPGRKRRKVATLVGRKRNTQRKLGPPQRP